MLRPFHGSVEGACPLNWRGKRELIKRVREHLVYQRKRFRDDLMLRVKHDLRGKPGGTRKVVTNPFRGIRSSGKERKKKLAGVDHRG